MKALLHKDGDVFLDVVVSDREAIKCLLEDRLSIVRGEYIPNVLLGLPLGRSRDEIDLSVIEIVSQTTGITGITDFKSSLVGKVYNCRFKASTIYGDIVYGNII